MKRLESSIAVGEEPKLLSCSLLAGNAAENDSQRAAVRHAGGMKHSTALIAIRTSVLAMFKEEFNGDTSLEDFGSCFHECGLWRVSHTDYILEDFLPQASASVADESITEGTLPDEPGVHVISRPLASKQNNIQSNFTG